MVLTWFDRIGDWNPQLFRELKGRLKPRNMMIIAALALLIQGLILFFFYNQLPLDATSSQRYCAAVENYDCVTDSLGRALVDWPEWWGDIFRMLNWGLIILPMAGGIFLLLNDLDQEERRGTLNFIRLSPQSGHNILLGKLLGTPALLYLGLLMLVPLHLMAAAGTHAPVEFVISFYVLLIAACGFLYSLALLGGFLGKLQPTVVSNQMGSGMTLVVVLFAVFVFIPAYISWNLMTNWNIATSFITGNPGYPTQLEWFYLPLGKNQLLSHGFTLLNLGLATYWIWHSLQRCYYSPTSTLLSKGQSYALVAYYELLMVGFCMDSEYDPNPDTMMGNVIVICFLNLPLFLVLIAILSPQRQTLLDWARYRHRHHHESQTHPRQHGFSASLWHDLIWGEKSPATVAIAINLGIMAAILLPWILTWPREYYRSEVLIGLAMSMTLIAIYGAIVQLLLLMKNQRRAAFATGALGLSLAVPTLLGGVLFSGGEQMLGQFVMLFSPILWGTFFSSISTLPPFLIFVAMGGHLALLTTLTAQLSLQLQKAGESSTKRLIAGGVSS